MFFFMIFHLKNWVPFCSIAQFERRNVNRFYCGAQHGGGVEVQFHSWGEEICLEVLRGTMYLYNAGWCRVIVVQLKDECWQLYNKNNGDVKEKEEENV